MNEFKKQLAHLHDAEIFGVYIDRVNKTLILDLKLIDEEMYSSKKLELSGVDDFYCTDFSYQNVILDVLIFNKADSSSYYSFCKNKLNIADDYFDNGKHCILYIEPSTGAELACTFTNFKISDPN